MRLSKQINELKKDNLMSGYIWTCKRSDNISIHTNQYGRLDFLTAVLLKIQVFRDVTLLLWLYCHNNTTILHCLRENLGIC